MQDFVPKFYMLLTSSGAVWQIEEGCVVDISEYVTHCTAPLNTFTFHFVHIYLSYVRDDSSREARSWTTSLLHYSHYVSLDRKDHRSQHYRKVRCKRWPPYTLRAFRMCCCCRCLSLEGYETRARTCTQTLFVRTTMYYTDFEQTTTMSVARAIAAAAKDGGGGGLSINTPR